MDDETLSQEEKDEKAEQEVKEIEDNPPENLEDWPDGDAKYKTLGGPDGNTGYEEGPTANLGEADVRHHEDGSVTVGGEEVDNPDDYKGDPIPGGPTDPNAADPEGLKNDDGEPESDAGKSESDDE
ncbi:MAG TPA: hypothetical protein VFY44_05825 [Thermoleophilaceae bacterium]|nr:hypothetical protein [Thermoleophilaceae bacterium]